MASSQKLITQLENMYSIQMVTYDRGHLMLCFIKLTYSCYYSIIYDITQKKTKIIQRDLQMVQSHGWGKKEKEMSASVAIINGSCPDPC